MTCEQDARLRTGSPAALLRSRCKSAHVLQPTLLATLTPVGHGPPRCIAFAFVSSAFHAGLDESLTRQLLREVEPGDRRKGRGGRHVGSSDLEVACQCARRELWPKGRDVGASGARLTQSRRVKERRPPPTGRPAQNHTLEPLAMTRASRVLDIGREEVDSICRVPVHFD